MKPWIVTVGVVMYGFVPMFAEEPKNPGVTPRPVTTRPVTTAPAEVEPQPAEVESQPTRVRLETTLGDIVIELDDARAPVTCQNFRDYVTSGYYDGTVFHRVIPDFMIQGGGFTPSLDERTAGLRPPIKNEAGNGLQNVRGTIAMARTPDPNSATAQFFINVVDNERLNQAGVHEVPVRKWPEGLTIPADLSARIQGNEATGALICRRGPLSEVERDRLLGLSGERPWQVAVKGLWAASWGYCVFGKVVEGMDVVDKIRHTETGPHPKYLAGQSKVVPVQPVIIRSARLISPAGAEPPVPQTLPTEGKDAETSNAGGANK